MDTQKTQQSEKKVVILLVEDDQGHARLIEKGLRRASVMNTIVTVTDGQAALDYLSAASDKTEGDHNLPILVLLDLNLPVLDGYQVLERMKANEKTKRIPVVVLTTTDDPREMTRCYNLGCSVYVTKPVDYERFSEAIQKLGLFIAIVTIPERS